MKSIFAPAPLWLAQARSDIAAARAVDLKDCHRRYLYQQAYEKALKAYLVARIVTRDETDAVMFILRDTILGTHSPLGDYTDEETEDLNTRLMRKYGNDWNRGAILLRLSRRAAEVFVRSLAGASVLRKIDGTRPTKDARTPSYRYPFYDGTVPIAPCDWTGWDAYQGTAMEVDAAVQELIDGVGLVVGRARRRR